MFTIFLIFLGLALFFSAYAWDGLVRRRALVSPFPRGAAFGGQSLLLKRVGALIVGAIAALLASGSLVLSLGSLLGAIGETCPGTRAVNCAYVLATSVPWPGWLWIGLCAGWFVLVWLLLGNPYQRVLVYGVWYYQDRVARRVRQALTAQGLGPLDDETIFALEERVRQFLRRERWLVYGQVWLDGGRPAPMPPPALDVMVQTALGQSQFQEANASERAVITFLLTYFLTQAQRVQQISPVKRFLVGRLQLGKAGSYGGRSL